AILAVGAVKKQPVVMEDGSIQPRARMKVTLSCDHRILDGATGARFLQELKRVLENPVLMVY
ncbi:MAG: 2-oxo acid dehydrogenase subunit E2, partial [Fimbriimonadales bacterium]|nr:2-oxo acid dehydrogenase subunit E2 [Fimbriimonadales bacterium]